jgi:hypothetical protein
MRVAHKTCEDKPGSSHVEQDPVVAMVGVGQQLWEHEPGDCFVERLRREEGTSPDEPPPPVEDLFQTVWQRIKGHQGESFRTSRGLPFTFEVEGDGIWFFRNQQRINRKLSRAQVEIAVSRCPLRNTTEIKDLMDFAYLYALLMDSRIRKQSW